MNRKPNTSVATAEIRRRAEAQLRGRQRNHRSKAGDPKSAADTQRLLHELEVHQIELEMQNAELQVARDWTEALLEKYTDLYDFAPVGYFSLDEQGRIMEVNLTGAALLGVERSRLINQRLPRFVVPATQPIFLAFLEQVFAGTGKQACEAALLKKDAAVFWASFHGTFPTSFRGSQKWCRVAVSDITSLKQAEEMQRRLDTLADTNRGLNQEIARRQTVEKALQKSEQHQSQLLKQSRHMQEQLRHLSHQILHAQEEERKRISRELHDVITQNLVGINVHLAAFSREVAGNPKGLRQKIARTRRLVEKSVATVHRFAGELRPTVLDDLGLIPALHAFMKEFTKRTGVRARLTVFAEVEHLNITKRTALYRVAHEALNNVASHANAGRVEVSIEKLPDSICMKIKDDGKSFSVERILHAKRNKRLGLVGMRERVEMVGGTFCVVSAPGQGTTVCVEIPLDKTCGGGGGNR